MSRLLTVLCCPNCGGLTSIPSRWVRFLKVACVLFFLAAGALLIAFVTRQP